MSVGDIVAGGTVVVGMYSVKYEVLTSVVLGRDEGRLVGVESDVLTELLAGGTIITAVVVTRPVDEVDEDVVGEICELDGAEEVEPSGEEVEEEAWVGKFVQVKEVAKLWD